MRIFKGIALGLALVAMAVVTTGIGRGELRAQDNLFVGTGAPTGVYYPAAGAVQRALDGSGLPRLRIESTGGSEDNVAGLRSGNFDLALVQSDVLASSGSGLVALFGMHDEPMAVVVRGGDGISSLSALSGRRVSVGPAGGGTESTFEAILPGLGFSRSSFTWVNGDPTGQARALCANEIDAYVFVGGHPSAVVQQAISSCGATLVPVTGVSGCSFVCATTIPAMYTGVPAVSTVGLRAVMTTTPAMSEDTAYRLTQAVINNLDTIRSLHPALANLQAASMATNGIPVPLHPGAQRAFREAGLL